MEVKEMSKRRKTRRICITVPEAFYAELLDQAEITGLSMSRLAWLRLKRNRCLIVPTDVRKTLVRVEQMLQADQKISFADRAVLEHIMDNINFLIKEGS